MDYLSENCYLSTLNDNNEMDICFIVEMQT